jgi:hypothetical protein
MIRHMRTEYRKTKAIVPITIPSTTAGVVDDISASVYGENFDVYLYCSTGTIFFNPLIAATTANGFRLNESEAIELKVQSNLSIIGDSTTAAYQLLILE